MRLVSGVSRLNLGIGGGLFLLAAVAWYLLVVQSSGMAMAMAIPVPVYLATWVTMLAAMMLPATAPHAIAYAEVAQARGGGRLAALPFSAGYLLLWTAAGLLPLAVFVGSGGTVAGMNASPLGSPALGVVLVVSGLYQLSPWKSEFLHACRSAMGHDFNKGVLGGLIAGGAHGAFCLGCCWALMAVLAVVGLMSLPWMAVLTLLILAEKNWSHGMGLARVAGAVMVAGGSVAVLASLIGR